MACPLFVPLVEEGRIQDSITTQVARGYLKPLQKANVDTLILGCTHYPLLKPTIAQVLGARVKLVDSARQVALKTQQVLQDLRQLHPSVNGRTRSQRHFFVTDEPKHFEQLARRFLGSQPGSVSKVDVTG